MLCKLLIVKEKKNRRFSERIMRKGRVAAKEYSDLDAWSSYDCTSEPDQGESVGGVILAGKSAAKLFCDNGTD